MSGGGDSDSAASSLPPETNNYTLGAGRVSDNSLIVRWLAATANRVMIGINRPNGPSPSLRRVALYTNIRYIK